MLRFFVAFFHVVVVGLVFFSAANSQAEAPNELAVGVENSGAVTVTRKDINTLGKGRLYFNLHRGKNLNGEIEVVVEFEEIRKNLPDSKAIVLYGRDITEDGKPDIWFYSAGHDDLIMLDQPSSTEDGWDVIPDILLRNVKVTERSFVQLVLKGVSSTFFFSKIRYDSFFQELMFEQMNILDLEARVERLKKAGLSPHALLPYTQTIASAWEAVLNRINSELYNELGVAVIDGLTLGYGGWVIGRLGRAVAKLGPVAAALRQKAINLLAPAATQLITKLGEKEGGKALQAFYTSFKSGVIVRAGRHLSKTGRGINHGAKYMVAPLAGGASRILNWTIEHQTQAAIRAISARLRVERYAWKSFELFLETSRQLGRRMPYISQTVGIQVFAELVVRRDQLLQGNPIIVEEQLTQMRQNVGYMGIETAMQATISSMMGNMSQRMVVCGALSLNNSMMYSFAMNGEPEPMRQSLDTRWEVVIGNLQTQMDIESLKFFEEMAAKSNRPKLKLIGYAFAVVDQFAGYMAYAWATKKLDSLRPQQPKLALIPLYSENHHVLEQGNILGSHIYQK